MLVSVRSVDEALQAADAGADIIDLKEPREGALGALAPDRIEPIVAAMRERFAHIPVSATTGDFESGAEASVIASVRAVAACGVDYVKVGIVKSGSAASLLRRLAQLRCRIVPVLLCDDGVDITTLNAACSEPAFPVVMADTSDKGVGSLFDCVSPNAMTAMVDTVRASGKLVGLAGALRLAHVETLCALAPDLAGFRGAVCRGDRTGELDPRKVRELADALRDAHARAESNRASTVD
jgi:uncharacterized protein (UPF0264 family)